MEHQKILVLQVPTRNGTIRALLDLHILGLNYNILFENKDKVRVPFHKTI